MIEDVFIKTSDYKELTINEFKGTVEISVYEYDGPVIITIHKKEDIQKLIDFFIQLNNDNSNRK